MKIIRYYDIRSNHIKYEMVADNYHPKETMETVCSGLTENAILEIWWLLAQEVNRIGRERSMPKAEVQS